MDTKTVAAKLGTSPRQLRQFLRSGHSTFQAVGSGARYDFTEKELPTIAKRFGEWRSQGRPVVTAQPVAPRTTPPAEVVQAHKDRKVWAEEGPIELEDIRNPRVRRRVLADARAAEDRLATLLIANGMHVLQGYTTTIKKAS